MKLPKQWMYWAQRAGLRSQLTRSRLRGYQLVGKDRHWRINCNGVFECSCPTVHFDRWANSRGAMAQKIPQSEQEFLETVKQLLILSQDTK